MKVYLDLPTTLNNTDPTIEDHQVSINGHLGGPGRAPKPPTSQGAASWMSSASANPEAGKSYDLPHMSNKGLGFMLEASENQYLVLGPYNLDPTP